MMEAHELLFGDVVEYVVEYDTQGKQEKVQYKGYVIGVHPEYCLIQRGDGNAPWLRNTDKVPYSHILRKE